MKRLILLLLTAAFFVPGSLPALAFGPNFVELAERLEPAVVNISTAKTVQPRSMPFPPNGSPHNEFFEEFFKRFFGDQMPMPRQERSLGTGFIISKDGYIFTNHHVIKGADEVQVRLADGRTFDAEIKGQDPKQDIALLKIKTKADLPFVTLGDSSKLKKAEWVLAIGNPFGLGHTVTAGIVSAKGRVIGAGPYDNFIQTDASINPGNSGGPLFNTKGEVVGINTAIIARGQGIGFAIPINAAKSILPQLKEKGRVTRGWLGVQIQTVTEDLAESFDLDSTDGALVTRVLEDSPALKAGVKRGDIITSVDGIPVKSPNDLARLIAGKAVGTKIPLTIYRNGKSQKITVTIGELQDDTRIAKDQSNEDSSTRLGIQVQSLTPETRQTFRTDATTGVVITTIQPSSAAAQARLRVGDVIVEINGGEIKSVQTYQRIVSRLKKGQVIRLLIQRGESLLYTTLKTQ